MVGTGESHTVREFLDVAFGYVDMDWKEYVRIDPKYFRPTEVDYLHANPEKAMKVLGWEPRVMFADLVRVMVDADLEFVGLQSPGKGRGILEAHHGAWHRWDKQVSSMDS